MHAKTCFSGTSTLQPSPHARAAAHVTMRCTAHLVQHARERCQAAKAVERVHVHLEALGEAALRGAGGGGGGGVGRKGNGWRAGRSKAEGGAGEVGPSRPRKQGWCSGHGAQSQVARMRCNQRTSRQQLWNTPAVSWRGGRLRKAPSGTHLNAGDQHRLQQLCLAAVEPRVSGAWPARGGRRAAHLVGGTLKAGRQAWVMPVHEGAAVRRRRSRAGGDAPDVELLLRCAFALHAVNGRVVDVVRQVSQGAHCSRVGGDGGRREG